jgi:septation ring formation regulator EzrA
MLDFLKENAFTLVSIIFSSGSLVMWIKMSFKSQKEKIEESCKTLEKCNDYIESHKLESQKMQAEIKTLSDASVRHSEDINEQKKDYKRVLEMFSQTQISIAKIETKTDNITKTLDSFVTRMDSLFKNTKE